MINLEVWNRAGFNMEHWVSGEYIMDNGPLGPIGKFGWFMPTFVVEQLWEQDRLIIDHWRALKVGAITEKFKVEEDDQQLTEMVEEAEDYSEEDYDVFREEGGFEHEMDAEMLDRDQLESGGREDEDEELGAGHSEAEYKDREQHYTEPICMGKHCDSTRIYHPMRCQGLRKKCAMLLASYAGEDWLCEVCLSG